MTDTSKLATSLLPEEIKKSWFQSLLGSTLGLAIMLLVTLFLYMGLVTTLSAFVEDLDGFRQQLGLWFWPTLLAPLGVIAVCVGLPAALKARRERLLRAVKITTGQRTAGAFRTIPYSQADAASFHRRDGANAQVVTWVDKSTQPLLYLTGASGTGKSSLLQVALLPQLSKLGWHTVLLRFDRDPEARLRAALVEEAGLWKSAPEQTDLAQLLRSAEAQAKRKKCRVLIVIDQFEEFLILNDDDAMRPVLGAFKALAKEGAQALRLLFVYRDDYGPLIFKRGLPPSVAGQNEFVLAPFLRPEAEAFLKTGGRELSQTAYDQLFRGLDRIEGTKGLYKLITLNMVGLVIERMGARLDVDPERLIDGYLREKLTEVDTRDHAVDVVSAIITDAGTKRPRTLGELAQDTKRADWQVRATLEKLRAAGLVRDVAGHTWEIAHDFLARQIGTLLGRLKPSWAARALRAGPAAALPALVVWAGLAGYLALDYWPKEQQRAALQAIADLGFTRVTEVMDGGGTREKIVLEDKSVSDAELERFVAEFGRAFGLDRALSLDLTDAIALKSLKPISSLISLQYLDLSGVDAITSLEPLAGLVDLQYLNLTSVEKITSLQSLAGLANLQYLDLTYADGIKSLEPLAGLAALQSLYLTDVGGISSLEPLKGLINLRDLTLTNVDGVTSLQPLAGLTNLQYLDLTDADGITSLEPLTGLSHLDWLALANADGITSLEPLEGLINLRYLNLTSVEGIASLEPLAKLKNLKYLDLTNIKRVSSLEPISGLSNLKFLSLRKTDWITSLEPLAHLRKLERLDLRQAELSTSLEPLSGLINLKLLRLSDARGILSLAPLRDLEGLKISGASSSLMATARAPETSN